MAKKKQKPVPVEEDNFDEEDETSVEDKTKDFDVPKTSEEMEDDMSLGKEEEEVYNPEGRQKLLEDDEIDDWEEGFMEGADSAGQLGKDALTGEPLRDVEDVIELEIKGKVLRFANKVNADKYKKKLAQKKK